MKKIIDILMTVLLMFEVAVAEGDITFNNIPWLSDEATAIQILKEIDMMRDGRGKVISYEQYSYLIVDDTEFVSPDRVVGADDVTFAIDLTEEVKGKIAGYPVKDLVLSFAYDGEYMLISVKVELVNGDYNDLKAKLTKVYGQGEHKETEEGLSSVVWKGENNSAVVLYTQSEGYDFTLMYGRLDASNILSNCLAAPDPDDVSGL